MLRGLCASPRRRLSSWWVPSSGPQLASARHSGLRGCPARVLTARGREHAPAGCASKRFGNALGCHQLSQTHLHRLADVGPAHALQSAAAAALSFALLAGNANAGTIKLGSDSGALVFEPATLTVAKGEKITFVNNRGFPHNVVFDADEIPVSAPPLTRLAHTAGGSTTSPDRSGKESPCHGQWR
jgi:plastocyanin